MHGQRLRSSRLGRPIIPLREVNNCWSGASNIDQQAEEAVETELTHLDEPTEQSGPQRPPEDIAALKLNMNENPIWRYH